MDIVLEYLRMGGYATFVWPAYGLSAAGLIWIAVLSVRGLRANRATLEALRQADPRRAARGQPVPADSATAEPERDA